jgi:hypothetical protein
MVSRLGSAVEAGNKLGAWLGAAADGRVNSPRKGIPIRSRTCLSDRSGFERR